MIGARLHVRADRLEKPAVVTRTEVDRVFDEYEVESEQAGPSYQLVLRWAF